MPYKIPMRFIICKSSLAEKLSGHAVPLGPIVTGAVAPDVESVGDVFGLEDTAEAIVFGAAEIGFARGEDDFHLAHMKKGTGVGEIGEEVGGAVEIDVVIVIAVDELVDVEGSAEAGEAGTEFGIAEGEVGGVVAAEAATGGEDLGGVVAPSDKGEDFVEEVVFVLAVAKDAVAGVDGFVVPGFGVDAIDTESLDDAGFVGSGGGTDHVALFVVEVAAHGGGEDEEGLASGSEDEHFHVPLEGGAKPFERFSIQVFIVAVG